MATLLIRLIGPMQSWGTTSRFDQRDTGKEPSKSGVLGLLAASLGIDRENWEDLKPLTYLTMGVRHDRPGILKCDYQTVGCARDDIIIKADGSQNKKDGIVSKRHYLADAAFLIGLEGDYELLQSIQFALQNPVWGLCLGRKSYLPSEMIWFQNGLRNEPLLEVMSYWPWISTRRKMETYPRQLLLSYESNERQGVLKMDQLLSSFSLRKFGFRFVKSEWILFPKELVDVSA